MIEDFKKHNGDKAEFNADLCIIGAGAAGITLARQFLNTKISVILLESGGHDYDKNAQSLAEGNISDSSSPYYDLGEARLRFFGGTTAIWGGRVAQLDAIAATPGIEPEAQRRPDGQHEKELNDRLFHHAHSRTLFPSVAPVSNRWFVPARYRHHSTPIVVCDHRPVNSEQASVTPAWRDTTRRAHLRPLGRVRAARLEAVEGCDKLSVASRLILRVCSRRAGGTRRCFGSTRSV